LRKPALFCGLPHFSAAIIKNEDKAEIAAQIAASGAQMFFVAITSPKKEIFPNKYKDLIRVPFIMSIGGSFDVISGKTNALRPGCRNRVWNGFIASARNRDFCGSAI